MWSADAREEFMMSTRRHQSIPTLATGHDLRRIDIEIVQDCRRLFDSTVEIADIELQRIGQALSAQLPRYITSVTL